MDGTSEVINNEEICETACTKPIGGFQNMENFVQSGIQSLINTTRSSNRLPLGKARDFYESYPSFHNLMKDESNKVLNRLNMLMRCCSGFKANLHKRDDDEKLEMIVEANDHILGRVGKILDQISGIVKYPEQNLAINMDRTMGGSWSINIKNDKVTAAQVLNEVFEKTKSIEKPQLKFKDSIDNSRESIFEPKIKYKYNMLKPLAITEEITEDGTIYYCHPYKFELERFTPQKEQLISVEPVLYKSLAETPFHFVTTTEEIKAMIYDCKKYTEIAVDLEHHSYRSFQGFTCLIQISTRDSDYIIDTLALRNDLEELNEIFTDPKIVKVFHGADSDLLWLQRDFGVYIVNLFDTFEAVKLLNYPRHSLSFLLLKFCNVEPEKHFQLADWRVRPLPEALLNYARGDTHYLLYIYDHLKNIFIEKGNGKPNYLESVISNCTNKCLTLLYGKPVWNEDAYLNLYNKSKKLFDNRQKYALKNLFDWRDNIGRLHDESYSYVLPNHMLLQISEALPREAQGILACCNPVPVLVRKYLLNLHQIILQARDQPLIEPVFEERRLYRSTGENNLIPMNQLNCPHDLNHEGEFQDDLPVLLSDKPYIIEKDEKLIAFKPVINVFERLQNSINSYDIKKTSILTPYQRYKQSKPFSETRQNNDIEAQSSVGSNIGKVKMETDGSDSILLEHEDQCLRKRKKEDNETIVRKKVNVEKNDKILQSHCNREKSTQDKDLVPKIKEGKKSSDIQPFNYSSVNFDQFQTYVEPKKSITPKEHSKGTRARRKKWNRRK